jgi:hypothetical protein
MKRGVQRIMKNEHKTTSPKKAGKLTDKMIAKNKEQDEELAVTMHDLLPIWNKSTENRTNYKGLWTEKTLSYEIDQFFRYCFDRNIRPCKSALLLWLDLSHSQANKWVKDISQNNYKGEMLLRAFMLMETNYIQRSEKYPTANLFLLKTNHGYVETSKVDVNNVSDEKVSLDEINEVVNRLGLGKNQ